MKEKYCTIHNQTYITTIYNIFLNAGHSKSRDVKYTFSPICQQQDFEQFQIYQRVHVFQSNQTFSNFTICAVDNYPIVQTIFHLCRHKIFKHVHKMFRKHLLQNEIIIQNEKYVSIDVYIDNTQKVEKTYKLFHITRFCEKNLHEFTSYIHQ